MMTRISALLALVAAILAVSGALSPQRAHACSCMVIEQPEAFEQAASVFEGRVASIEASGDPHGGGQVRVTLDVVRTWKGADSEQVEVVTAANSAACGYNFEQGESYLVYTHAGEPGAAENVSLCSRTAPIGQADEDLAAMGEGVTPVSPRDPAETDPPTEPASPGSAQGGNGQTTQYEAGCASCAVGAERSPAAPALMAGALLVFAAVWRRRR